MFPWRNLARRVPFAAAAVVGGATLLGSVVLAQADSATPKSYSTPPGALIAPGEPADLTLLYTGDVIGYVDPCG